MLYMHGPPTGAIAIGKAHFGSGVGPIHLDNLECTGDEETLEMCPVQGVFITPNCVHDEDASVVCQGKCMLVMVALLQLCSVHIISYSFLGNPIAMLHLVFHINLKHAISSVDVYVCIKLIKTCI